jgi:hypothetical protein
MTMHEKQWGGSSKPWGENKDTTNAKPWPSTWTKQATPRSISTTTTAERSTISYDIYLTKHRFTNSNHVAASPTDNVWI